jgi:hypothetical protein
MKWKIFRVYKAGGQKWNKMQRFKALSEGRRKRKIPDYNGWKVNGIVYTAEGKQKMTAKNWLVSRKVKVFRRAKCQGVST